MREALQARQPAGSVFAAIPRGNLGLQEAERASACTPSARFGTSRSLSAAPTWGKRNLPFCVSVSCCHSSGHRHEPVISCPLTLIVWRQAWVGQVLGADFFRTKIPAEVQSPWVRFSPSSLS